MNSFSRLWAAVAVALAVSMPSFADTAISVSEANAIRFHVSKFWNIPAGFQNFQNVEELRVKLRFAVQPDGTVINVQEVDQPPNPSSDYLALSDSAQRALHMASPLPIPQDKSSQFAHIVMVFDLGTMVARR